jgi:hypothetical protein
VLFAFGGGLGFCVRHFCADILSQLGTGNSKSGHGVPCPYGNRLQLAGAAERT